MMMRFQRNVWLPALCLILFVAVMPGKVHGQHIYGAMSVGMNLTQVDGDEVYGFNKVGLNVGPSVIIPFGKKQHWSVTMELLYSQLGSRQHEDHPNTDSIADTTGLYDGYKLNLNYIQVPIMVHFTDKKVIAGGVGFLYGARVGYSELEEYNDIYGWHAPASTVPAFSTSDFQVLADVRIRLVKRLWLNARYSYSIIPIRERTYENPIYHNTWTRKQYNNVITLRLTYIFNEPLPVKNKKGSTKK